MESNSLPRSDENDVSQGGTGEKDTNPLELIQTCLKRCPPKRNGNCSDTCCMGVSSITVEGDSTPWLVNKAKLLSSVGYGVIAVRYTRDS